MHAESSIFSWTVSTIFILLQHSIKQEKHQAFENHNHMSLHERTINPALNLSITFFPMTIVLMQSPVAKLGADKADQLVKARIITIRSSRSKPMEKSGNR
jgi:hypothetical protein